MRGVVVGAVSALAVVASVALARGRGAHTEVVVPGALGDPRACAAYDGVPTGFPTTPHAGMVLVRGGRFVVGSDAGYREERPAGEVEVGDFYLDRTEVTNAQFARFVAATGYVTVAERVGSAPVFEPESDPEVAFSWWRAARAHHADPDGTGIGPASNEPVVQLALEDAFAYADWLGRDLPTEAEWEWAARAGRDDAAFDRAPRAADGKPLANFWQGAFPARDDAEDGFAGRAPVGCFPANPLGLHDLVGNVWEWTREPWFASHAEAAAATQERRSGASAFVLKGGSFLCSQDFCTRYRPTSRHRQLADETGPHIGFRTVLRTNAPASAARHSP